MSVNLQLSPDEYEVINSVIVSLEHERGYTNVCKADANLTIQNWFRTVKMVEEGYSLEVFEYENDLDGRQHLGRVVSRLPQSLREKLVSTLQPWDDRFKNATFEVGENLCTPQPEELGWWCYRAPLNIKQSGRLADWLRGIDIYS